MASQVIVEAQATPRMARGEKVRWGGGGGELGVGFGDGSWIDLRAGLLSYL